MSYVIRALDYSTCVLCRNEKDKDCGISAFIDTVVKESSAVTDKPAWLETMPKLLQFGMFRFIAPNSILPNFKLDLVTCRMLIDWNC